MKKPIIGNDQDEKEEDENAHKKIALMMRLKGGVAIRMVETNLFTFQFFTHGDKEKVTNGRPWEDQIAEGYFYTLTLLIQIYDLPFAKRNAQFAKMVGECMGDSLR
ncbi:SRSF protein kinase 1 [Bienertia sinuspersici]